MAPLAMAAAAVFALGSAFALLPSWAWIIGGVALIAVWAKLIDADLLTFIAGLRGVPKKAVHGGVWWVLGASSGIGEELAKQIAAKGGKVVLSARRKDELERVAKAIRAKDAPYPPFVLPLDVLDEKAHAEAAKAIVAKYGTIDYVVLNVGRTQRALAEDTAVEVTRQMLELNVVSQVSLAQVVLPTFLKQGSGCFVVTSSVSGKFGAPAATSYCASKFALHGYFDALRLELADRGIRVLLACPGPVQTPIESAAFTGIVGEKRGKTTENLASKMPVERCAHLMLAAATRGIDEAWITQQPVLLFSYLSQYAPDLARFVSKKWLGPMRTKAFKEGRDIFAFKQMATGGGGGAAVGEGGEESKTD